MNVDLLALRLLAIGRKEAVYQSLQTIGLSNDDARAFPILLTNEVGLKELRRTADAAQRILDFVRKISKKLPVGVHQLAVHPLPVLMKRFLDINDFNQNTGVPAGGPAFGQARQHGLNADVVRLSAGMRPEQTPKHAGGLHGRPRRQMRIPLVTLRETVAKVRTDKRSPRTSQQHFGRTVAPEHPSRSIGQQHRGGHHVENGKRGLRPCCAFRVNHGRFSQTKRRATA